MLCSISCPSSLLRVNPKPMISMALGDGVGLGERKETAYGEMQKLLNTLVLALLQAAFQ